MPDSTIQQSESSQNEKIKDHATIEATETKHEGGSKEKLRGEKKRSKSSYSIPALCQISVNIGNMIICKIPLGTYKDFLPLLCNGIRQFLDGSEPRGSQLRYSLPPMERFRT